MRILFVSNGHGETAIAARIARELRAISSAQLDHLPLVGEGATGAELQVIGPRATMPSGGLVAMGNVGNLARDLRAGFAGLLAAQTAFLRREGRAYDAIVAVGDIYALSLALLAGRPVIYVGTAKSVHVAPYGPFERTVLRRAARIFVRDAATAQRLRSEGVAAEAPGNVIADLGAGAEPAASGGVVLLPGSRPQAYRDAVRLAAVIRALADRADGAPGSATLSVAPGLDAATMGRVLAEDGWAVLPARTAPFIARSRAAIVTASFEPIGVLLRAASIAIGQAGTANELAAALGVPVIALELGGREDWYRMRQRKLLGEAMRIVPADPRAAAADIAALIRQPGALAAMRAAGVERMGAPGGARAIAEAVAAAA
jgi:uncharacterized protein (TIGR03492 family)